MSADTILKIYDGPHGLAIRAALPDTPRSLQTVCHWLITAPGYHPLWSQYALMVVRLEDDVPGFPPPYRQFPEATHELICLALNPEHGTVNALQLTDPDFRLRFLTPVNHAHQFTATDAELEELADLACRAVTDGVLNPETGDAPDRIRQAWKASLTATLEHLRGGHQ